MPNNSQILDDRQLAKLTLPFLKARYSKDLALQLVHSLILSMITEPGDRMAGALARCLGKADLVSSLLSGLDTRRLVQELKSIQKLDALEQQFGNIEAVLADSRQRWLPRLTKSRLENLLLKSNSLDLALVIAEDDNWPLGLDDLQDAAPFALFVDGIVEELSNLDFAVSIVGSRACSQYGAQVTTSLVQELAKVSRATVSGGAVGIDAHVHKTSIVCQLPTVAVMAGGLDRKYPKVNFGLFDRIKQQGAIVSELPPGVQPSRWRFLQRNRLIAAITKTTVVVEAGVRSGSIRTANNALELDRELYAVPGSVLSNTSAGTNALICEGKALALSNLKEFASGVQSYETRFSESALATRAQDAIRDLGFPNSSEIAKAAGLTSQELHIALNELKTLDRIVERGSEKGSVHYALKYAY